MLAPGNSMQADLHTPRFPYVLIIYFLPVLLFATLCSSSFCCIFICTNLKQPCSCLRAAHFIEEWALSGWHLRCAVFSYVQTPDILCKRLYAPHSIGESHAMTAPSIYCFFICTNPNQTSILGSGGNLQLPHAKKKLIELSFKSCRAWWPGSAHRFEVWTRFAWGLFGVCTYENTAC